MCNNRVPLPVQSDALGSDLLSLIHPWDVDEMCDWLAEAHELLAEGMQRGGSRVCAALPAKLLRFRSLQSNRRTVHKSFSFKLANCVAKLVGALALPAAPSALSFRPLSHPIPELSFAYAHI